MAYTEGAGPALALLVVGGLVLASRWVFSTSGRDRRMAEERRSADHGLLVPAITMPGKESAMGAASRLLAAGIKATVAPAAGPDRGEPVRISADGRVLPRRAGVEGHHVLVFPVDLERAQALLRS